MHKIILILTISLALSCGVSAQNSEPIARIAFGSCSHQDDTVQLWKEILAQQPDLWIWMGDNIYGDTHDMELLEAKYDLQKSHPDYQALLQSTKVIGTWDDHDYGMNDGGKFYARKKESRELAADFLGISAKAPLRKRYGMYDVYEFGKVPHKLKVILLDTRYFRDTLMTSSNKEQRYMVNEEGDILGEEQWQWLEKELEKSDADIHIIGSSIQLVATQHAFEKWSNFPKARARMLSLLAKTKPANTFFISGDRHIAEISKMNVKGLPYPLYDFTSSGLTHTWSTPWEEPNDARVGQLIIQKNYGLIKINWTGNLPLLEFEIRGHDGKLWQSIPVILPKPE